ncbi:MAG: hypothetical protein COT85_00550 [Chlamydiae bacterium CG10_big_fil_rev_8_21_14_0_10_42_34]|nr:MAG: hypothetical protein COT85_00550 [Chlamydiae bacterium CG10_big_fil_rev_8_21_14_0_10_42_34]
MQPFPKKDSSPNFSNPQKQTEFVQETKDSKSLTQKELNVNQAEQVLLNKRIELMKSFINELPSSDPQYSMLVTQVQMDRIELDELKARATILLEKLS